MSYGTAEMIDHAQQAKMVKAALAKAYKGVRFSVRAKRYSGGGRINVDWTDGPTEKQVAQIAHQYEGGGFDGMIDLAYSYTHWLLPDGSCIVAHSNGTEGSMGSAPAVHNPRPAGAREVHFLCDTVFCNRTTRMGRASDDEVYEMIGRDLCTLQRVEYCGRDTVGLFGVRDRDYLCWHVRRLLDQTAIPAGRAYKGVRFATVAERDASIDCWAVIEFQG